jgi:hypothetical protein
MGEFRFSNTLLIESYFLENNIEKAINMKLMLSMFEQLSGLKINFYKSEIFCFGKAKNTEHEYR